MFEYLRQGIHFLVSLKSRRFGSSLQSRAIIVFPEEERP